MTWEGYTVTGCGALGEVVAQERRVMSRHQAMKLAVTMRVEGLRVSVWPALPKDLQREAVEHLKALVDDN